MMIAIDLHDVRDHFAAIQPACIVIFAATEVVACETHCYARVTQDHSAATYVICELMLFFVTLRA